MRGVKTGAPMPAPHLWMRPAAVVSVNSLPSPVDAARGRGEREHWRVVELPCADVTRDVLDAQARPAEGHGAFLVVVGQEALREGCQRACQ